MKDIESIVDKNIRERVKARIEQFGGKIGEALKDLNDNPIWADDLCTIPIKTVRCFTGLKSSAVTTLRVDENGRPISFVKPANNHHIAIYRDVDGNLHEHVVTFWTAVERIKNKVPVVIKSPVDVWDSLIDRDDLSEEFLSTLPDATWIFVESMQQNEMFIIGMSDDEYNDAKRNNDVATLCHHLYRVQKIASLYYVFRLHIETTVDDKYNGEKNQNLSIRMGKFVRIQSLGGFKDSKLRKVKIDVLGNIIDV